MEPVPAPLTGSVNIKIFLFVCSLTALIVLSGCCETPVSSGPVTEPPKILIDFTRTGGIAGVDDHLVIFSNGQAVFSTRGETGDFILGTEDVSHVQKIIQEADFPNLSHDYPAPVEGADYFMYTLTVENATVYTETTGIPEQLDPLIAALQEILASRPKG